MSFMKQLIREDEGNLIVPTIEWMSTKYREMNDMLFSGKLGDCSFEIFTTGNGANGRVLGWFSMRKGLKYSRSSRRMYYLWPDGYKEYIDRDNFVELCKPVIKLNGNYKWTEKAALSTLVHEMCHYYTNMYGYVPTRAHGNEFKNIAYIVSSKSNGIFTVSRLASAEQMDEMELDANIAAKNQQRKENRENRIILTFILMNNGEIRLVNSNSMKLVDLIVYNYKNNKYGNEIPKEILISTDENLKKEVFNARYNKACTTYRYWNVENENFAKNLSNYDTKCVFSTIDINQNSQNIQGKKLIIPHFRFQTVQGTIFDVRNVTKDELRQKLKERFPKWSDDVINRVINTEKYMI